MATKGEIDAATDARHGLEEGVKTMMVCQECQGRVKAETLAVYEDDLLGIPVILLDSAIRETCEACGTVVARVIPDLDGLIAAAAATRAMQTTKLTGTDIRFLRKAVGLSGRSLAEALEVQPETLSRWENDREVIGPTSEKLLRIMTAGVFAADRAGGRPTLAAAEAFADPLSSKGQA